MSKRFEVTELEKLINALRGKRVYAVSLDKYGKPKSVAVKLHKGQMNVYEGGLDGSLSVTIDHMSAVRAEHVLELLGIEVEK